MASHRKQCPHGSFGTLVAVAAAAGVAGAAAGAALMWARARHAPHDTSGSGCPSRPEAAATARGGDHHSDIKASSSAASPAGATVDNGGDGGAAAATLPGHASLSVRGQSALKPPFSYLGKHASCGSAALNDASYCERRYRSRYAATLVHMRG